MKVNMRSKSIALATKGCYCPENVEVAAVLQEKTLEITKNGTYTITAADGYAGLGNIVITVNVEGGASAQLDAPANVAVSAATLSFDSVENAESYSLLVDGTEIGTLHA